MKKRNLIILTILALAIIYSCKKEPFNNPSGETNKQSYTAEELSIWKKLNNFNQLIKSNEKSGESISADSAIWLMEALFNATETSREPFNDFYTDSAFYTIPIDNDGNMNMDDVGEVYNTMVNDFQTRLSAFSQTHKIIVLGDLVKIGNAKSGDIHVVVSRGFGLNTLSFYDDFNVGENWYYGNMMGMCNGDSIWASDAGFELERRFNNPGIQYPVSHDSAHIVAHSVVYKVAYAAQEHPDFMYNIKWPNGDTCIADTTLNRLLVQGHENVIYEYESMGGERPEGKDFLAIDVKTNIRGAINRDSLYYHLYELWYANFINIPPIED